MRTVLEILNLSTEFLKQKNISHPRRQAEELLSDALGMKRMDLYLDFNRPLHDAELERCRAWLQRRSKGEPLQYIVGSVSFFGCTCKVSPAVLIPRQETEILVDKIAKHLATLPLVGKVLWDVCCGSGCIGIALKKKFPELTVVLSDISKQALAVAQENARHNEIVVECLEGDLFVPLQDRKADFIVCNPPYIAENELKDLDREVRDYEPVHALVSGKTGLEFYIRLAEQLPTVLNRPGLAWLEIGATQGSAIKNLFNGSCWKKTLLENDWSGRERFFSLEIE